MNKKKITIIVLSGVLLIICILTFIFVNSKETDITGKEILFKRIYSNMSWGFQYSEIVILRDGSILCFSTEEQEEVTDNLTYRPCENLKFEKVSNKDIKLIEKYASKVTDKDMSDMNMSIFDAGNSVSYVFDKKNREIILSDWPYKSNDDWRADKILEIVEEYI